MKSGWVYLLANDSMIGLYKIGFTTRPVSERVEELSRPTSVPQPFRILLSIGTLTPGSVERDCHRWLSGYRRCGSREFFCFENDVEACQKMLMSVASSKFYHPPSCEIPAKDVITPSQPTRPPTEEEARKMYEKSKAAIAGLRSLMEDKGESRHGS